MQYDMRMSPDRCYVWVKVRATVNAALAAEFASDAAAFGIENGLNTFLIEIRGVPRIGGLLQTYLFSQQFAKLGFPGDALIAILVDPGETSQGFMQTVARGQGLRCRVFDDPDAARGWLRRGHAHASVSD